MREENLPKKVFQIIQSGELYEQTKVGVHEFRQKKQVLKLRSGIVGDTAKENELVIERYCK